MSSFINDEEEKRIIKEIEEIINDDDEAIINPFDNNVHPLIRDIVCPNMSINSAKIAKIINNQVQKYDCNKDINKKSKECENIVGEDTIIGRHIINLKNKRIKFDERVLLGAINKYNDEHDTVRSDSPTTVIDVPNGIGGRKKTRKKRRKKKSKRKNTRRRRKKKSKRKKKNKKRKKSKRKKRSRKLRGGNYWTFNPDTKKYECYITVNHKNSKKHWFGKIAKFDSLTKFTRHMCKNYNKEIPGLIQHPKIFNRDDPELTIIKDRKKGADNSGINIYQYRCGNCGKIITYNDRREKSIHFPGWNFTKLPSPDKKEQNLDKFNEYINKQRKRKQEQSINDGRLSRSDSAHDFKYREVSPSVYKKDYEYYEPYEEV